MVVIGELFLNVLHRKPLVILLPCRIWSLLTLAIKESNYFGFSCSSVRNLSKNFFSQHNATGDLYKTQDIQKISVCGQWILQSFSAVFHWVELTDFGKNKGCLQMFTCNPWERISWQLKCIDLSETFTGKCNFNHVVHAYAWILMELLIKVMCIVLITLTNPSIKAKLKLLAIIRIWAMSLWILQEN